MNVGEYHPPSLNSLPTGNRAPKDDHDKTGFTAAAPIADDSLEEYIIEYITVVMKENFSATPTEQSLFTNSNRESIILGSQSGDYSLLTIVHHSTPSIQILHRRILLRLDGTDWLTEFP